MAPGGSLLSGVAEERVAGWQMCEVFEVKLCLVELFGLPLASAPSEVKVLAAQRSCMSTNHLGQGNNKTTYTRTLGPITFLPWQTGMLAAPLLMAVSTLPRPTF